MVKSFYTTPVSVDIALYELFCAKVCFFLAKVIYFFIPRMTPNTLISLMTLSYEMGFFRLK